jgi:hypothetical protein
METGVPDFPDETRRDLLGLQADEPIHLLPLLSCLSSTQSHVDNMEKAPNRKFSDIID